MHAVFPKEISEILPRLVNRRKMVCLHTKLTREMADTYGLVLRASGIDHLEIHDENDRWSIWVPEPDFAEAWSTIETFDSENSRAPAAEDTFPRPSSGGYWSTASVCAMLIAAYLAAGSGEAFRDVVGQCGASATAISNGEIFRVATALMLHASPAHILGNIVSIAVFGTAVCRITGSGAGWLLILLTGILGNLANALFIGSNHVSVGASTAAFGAVGIVSAYQFSRKRDSADRRIKAWMPLAGGLALLGFLGVGPHTDLMAHLFGFGTGILLGLLTGRYTGQPLSASWQAHCMTIAVCLLGGSWVWAYFS